MMKSSKTRFSRCIYAPDSLCWERLGSFLPRMTPPSTFSTGKHVSTINPYLSGGTKDLHAASLVLEPLARYDENGHDGAVSGDGHSDS